MPATDTPAPHTPLTPLPVMGGDAYVDTVGPLELRGANPSTHLANVRYPGQPRPQLSVVKLVPPREACNEGLAHTFLQAAGVPAPRTAALLLLPAPLAVQAVGLAAAQHYVHGNLALAWAAELLPHRSLRALFKGRSADDEWLRLLTTAAGAQLAAFDEAFGNIDRNTGNVLFAARNECWAIDHGQLFHMHDWMLGVPPDAGHSDPVRTLHRAQRGGRLAAAAYEQACARLVAAADRHRDAFVACRRAMCAVITSVYGYDGEKGANHVLRHVARRTMRGWMATRIGMLQ